MKKYIIYALLASSIGIMSNPEMLSASDKVAVNGISGVVETVSPEMFTPMITEVARYEADLRVPDTGVAITATPVRASAVVAKAPAVVSAPNSVTIAGVVMETTGVAYPETSVGDGVYSYENRYFYAHNPGKFTVLTRASLGDAITVMMNGAARTYHVTEVIEMEQAELNAESGLSNAQMHISVIGAVQEFAYSEKTGAKHKIVLQTCLGENRLLVFAD